MALFLDSSSSQEEKSECGSVGEKLEKGDLVKEESQNVGNRRCGWLQFGDLDLNN